MIFIKIFEERKADIDGFEIPIQCILQTFSHSFTLDVAHYHDYVEVLYGLDCDVLVWQDGESHPLRTGDMFIINSRKTHTVHAINKESSYVVIKFLPQILYAAEQSVFEFKYVLPFISDAEPYKNIFTAQELEGSEIPSIIASIMEEWDNKSYGYEIALRIYVSKLVLWLLRSWSDRNVSYDSFSNMAAIQRAVEYAQKNFATATLESAADYCGLSYSYFSRNFKRVMKRSFTEYVTYIKITEAKRLLASTDLSITDISLDAGFSTTSYFIDIFKKHTKMTPMQFRSSLIHK